MELWHNGPKLYTIGRCRVKRYGIMDQSVQNWKMPINERKEKGEKRK
jgi:hypothetical protein